MNELKTLEKSIFAKHVKLTKTSLELPPGIEYKEWEHIGKTLQDMGGAIHWWIGDWIRYGENNYGEKYTQAIEETGYDYDTLRHDVYVCSAVDLCRRRHNLSFSAHSEVAALSPEQQTIMLDRAEKESMTSKDIREAVKGKPVHKDSSITCPFCKQSFNPKEK